MKVTAEAARDRARFPASGYFAGRFSGSFGETGVLCVESGLWRTPAAEVPETVFSFLVGK